MEVSALLYYNKSGVELGKIKSCPSKVAECWFDVCLPATRSSLWRKYASVESAHNSI
jgi:hypothetical protein